MTSTAANVFEATYRLVECDHCGAPVTARVGGEKTSCGYCGRDVIVSARPNDRERPESAAEEVARLRQLAGQQHTRIGRDRYDLSGVPKALQALGVTTKSPAKRLRVATKHLKERGDLDAQLGLVWVAIEDARRWYHQGKLEKARARLETSLEWVRDPGHRDLLRCELIRFAVRAKEIDAAESWLSECTSAPVVLELDSAHRYARALIALAYGELRKAEALLGVEGEMPVATSHVAHFVLARAQCAMLRRDFTEAERIVRSNQEHLIEMLEVSRRDDLATDLVTRVTDEWKEQSRRREGKPLYEKANRMAFSLLYSRSPMRVFFYAGWLALVLGMAMGGIHSLLDDGLFARNVVYPLCEQGWASTTAGPSPSPPFELTYEPGRVVCQATVDGTPVVTVSKLSSWSYLYFLAGYAPFLLPFALLAVLGIDRRGKAARIQRDNATEKEIKRVIVQAGRPYRGLRTAVMYNLLLGLAVLPIFIGALSLFQSLL